MYTVYILKDKNGKLYKGFTNNLDRRIKEHKRGKTITTKKMCDIELVYTENFDNFKDARKREVYFKTSAGRRFLKNKI
ncbi:GIY-YIG nuclease family protein [Candidatus Parcubacteria bacterium]|nr:GIY-YIG nuclease family protein [Candidatus Parcubacteria bacterium]